MPSTSEVDVGARAVGREGQRARPLPDLDLAHDLAGLRVDDGHVVVGLAGDPDRLAVGRDPHALGLLSDLARSSGSCRWRCPRSTPCPRPRSTRTACAPSRLMSKFSGSEPPGSTRVTLRLAASTTAMPSFDLSALSFSHSSSGIVGGHLGEPLSATKTVLPSVAHPHAAGPGADGNGGHHAVRAGVDDGQLLRVLVGDVGQQGRRRTAAAAGAGVGGAWRRRRERAVWRRPQAAAAAATDGARSQNSFRIEDRLVAVAGLVEPLDRGPRRWRRKVRAVDVGLGELGAREVGPGEVGLDQLGVAQVGAR